MTEEWRPVDGYEGLYEVSNLGRLKALPRFSHAGKAGWRWSRKRILNGSIDRYQFVNLRSSLGSAKHHYVHRLVADAFLPNPDGKPCINHIDGDKLNNRADNLEWVTYQENSRHAIDTGLAPRRVGDAHHSTKLSDEQVSEIRAAYVPWKNSRELAERYGVSRKTINAIANGHARCSACKEAA